MSKSAKASKYLHHLKKYFKKHPDMRVVIYCRVSACMQGCKGNLMTYKKLLRRRLKKLGIHIIGRCHCEVSSGWNMDFDKRPALKQAIEKAQKHIARGKNVVIVAASSDRFLRNKDYTTNQPDLLPTKAEFEELKELTCNIPLATLLNPDMPPKQARGIQSKWGQKAKRNQGGRPRKKAQGYKKQEKLEKLPIVLRLYKKGRKVCEITFKTGIKRSTIKDWIKKYAG